MIRLLKMLFCRHSWDQRVWGGSESGYLCVKCGRIQYRKGPGGPPPPGVSFGPKVEPYTVRDMKGRDGKLHFMWCLHIMEGGLRPCDCHD